MNGVSDFLFFNNSAKWDNTLDILGDDFFPETDLVRRLVSFGTEFGLSGNLWQQWLTYELMIQENPFTLTYERQKLSDGATLLQMAETDFRLFRKLFFTDFAALGREQLKRVTRYQAPYAGYTMTEAGKRIDALCRKRYTRNCVEDRTDMMIGTIANRVTVICLQQIEHYVRNAVQTELHETVMLEYDLFGKWKDVAADLGVTNGTLQTLRRDDGTSFGPSLREAVLHYCGLNAAAGIRPLVGFRCLTDEDYTHLNKMADYVISVSGTGRFKGDEYA